MKLDTTGSSWEAAEQLIRVVDEIQKMPDRNKLPPNGLVIGPHRSKKPLSVRLLEITKRPLDIIYRIDAGNSYEIYEQLSVNKNDRNELREVGIAILGYFLHNFCEEQRQVILSFIKCHCPESIVIVADYTLKDVPPEVSSTLLASEFEQRVIKEKGMDRFLKEHSSIALDDLVQSAINAGWENVIAGPLKAGRGIMIATNNTIVAGQQSFQKRLDSAFNSDFKTECKIP